MKLDDVFKIDTCVMQLSEDVMTNRLGRTSSGSGLSYMKKMQDLFKVDGKNPEEAIKQVINILLSSKSRTAKVYMNGILQGGTRAGIKIDYTLRKEAENFINENNSFVLDTNTSIVNLNGVSYDQLSGLGSIPYNQEISYFGSEIHMTPSKFRSLVPKMNNTNNSFVYEHIKSNKPISSPWLFVRFGDSSTGRIAENSYIIGHDGSSRVNAVNELYGDIPMVVHLIYSGCRANDISSNLLEETNKGLIAEKGSYVLGPLWVKKD